MHKFIKRTITFLLFAICFYIVILFVWGKYLPSPLKPNLNYRIGSYGKMFSRMQEVKTVSDVDILFLGSSHTYRGFDTRIFKENGFNTFNLGSSSQTPIQTMILLRRYLDRLNPKLIIYEINPDELSEDGVESALDIIANDKNDMYSIKMALNLNHTKVYNTLMYGLMQDFFKLNNSFIEAYKSGDDEYIPGGFVQKKISYYSPTTQPKSTIEFNDKQLSSFETIVNLIKEKNIPLIFVFAPIPVSTFSQYVNNAYFDSFIESYSTYYNFNEMIHLNDSLDFYDFQHLNQNGVEIFDKKLIEILQNN